MSLLPRPLLSHPEVVRWSVDELPVVLPPQEHAAVVAVIDSGIQAGNPLLAPAVAEALSAVPEIPDGSDETGHGSLVASLALYGSLEGRLDRREMVRAAGTLLGIRVLDAGGNFVDDRLWQRQVEDALELAVAHGARVVNLSIGDPRHPYRPPAPTAIASVLDGIAREHDVVLVVSAGNVHWEDPPGSDYARWSLAADETGLAPPAMSAIALTVGALVADGEQGMRPARESVAVRAVGRPGTPSPVSRTGPGIEHAIKPELCAPGGTYVYDSDQRRIRADHAAGKIVGAAGGRPDALLATDTGTSFAAPLVTHAALRVFGRYPQLSARAVRALVLASVRAVPCIVEGESENHAVKAQRHLSGFGRVDAERAEHSTDHRVVLLAEEQLLPDQVHFYTVPVPSAFFRPGRKDLNVALAFDPATRATRLTYLASRMSAFVYRGVSVDDVSTKFAASQGEPPDTLDSRKVDLSPSDTDRLLGANQAASKHWTRSWNPDEHDELVIVVRSTNRWAAPDQPQPYALTVVLEAVEDMLTLYNELQVHFEALAEVEPEIEIR
ncbi:MAG: S8 family serine peptidase [Pseudonocardiaceae bacterium]|nr:S8 family serine peptidase [Pseudonocardiaceae bacterium]